jgi:hypothetical protein
MIPITIKVGDKKKPETETVLADLYGQWAVHETPGYLGGAKHFTVTHEPTGRSVLNHLPEHIARRIARKLQAEVPEFTEKDGPAWQKAAPLIKEIINARAA